MGHVYNPGTATKVTISLGFINECLDSLGCIVRTHIKSKETKWICIISRALPKKIITITGWELQQGEKVHAWGTSLQGKIERNAHYSKGKTRLQKTWEWYRG